MTYLNRSLATIANTLLASLRGQGFCNDGVV